MDTTSNMTSSLFNLVRQKFKKERIQNSANEPQRGLSAVGYTAEQSNVPAGNSSERNDYCIFLISVFSYLIFAAPVIEQLHKDLEKYNCLTKEEKFQLQREAKIREHKLALIENPLEREEKSKKLFNVIEDAIVCLSKQCGWEGIMVFKAIEAEGKAIHLCGPRSMMALRKLMDTKLADDIYASATTSNWNFSLIPEKDQSRLYVEYYHILARECRLYCLF